MEESVVHSLAHVQNSLKKEKVIGTLTESRLKILNQQLCDNFDEILAKRKLFMYMNSYYLDLFTNYIVPNFFSSLFSDEKALHPSKSSTSRVTLKNVRYFRENTSNLAKSTFILISHDDKIINILTYSTIPAIFGLLTQYSEQLLFLQFLDHLYESDNRLKNSHILFARALFMIPEFRIYIQAIADQASIQFCTIHGTESAEQFLNEFLTNAEKYIHICPPIFSKLAKKNEYSVAVIKESFFQQLITNPLLFGFVQIGESESLSDANSILLLETAQRINFIPKLVDILQKSENNDKSNVYSNVSQYINAYQRIYYLTTYDVQLISVLASLSEVSGMAVVEQPPSEYVLNIFQDTVLFNNSEEIDFTSNIEIDPLLSTAENSLRSLLLYADPFPSSCDTNLSSFFQLYLINQVPSHLRHQQQIHFSILKSCKKQYKRNHIKKITFEDFIKLLIPNIQNYKNETNDNGSEKLQNYTTYLTQMINAKNKITDFVTEKKFEISYLAITYCFDANKVQASNKAFQSKTGLISYFTSIQKTWAAFAKSTEFTAEIPTEMLLVYMLKLYTYEYMVLLDKELSNWDILYNSYTSNDYDTNQDNKKLDNLFKNESERFTQAIDLIKRGFQVPSTLLAMKLISASLKSIYKLLSEVIGPFAMDDLTSALFYVVYVARPPNFISKTEYFYRIFQAISDFGIDEYREYINNTLYLHQTAVYFFHNANPNPLQQDTFMTT